VRGECLGLRKPGQGGSLSDENNEVVTNIALLASASNNAPVELADEFDATGAYLDHRIEEMRKAGLPEA